MDKGWKPSLSGTPSGGDEGQQCFIYGERRFAFDARALFQQEVVPHDFRLLLQSVAVERATRHDVITISAERMAHQWQIPFAAPLCLPDMRHFMNEMPLKIERRITEVGAEQSTA